MNAITKQSTARLTSRKPAPEAGALIEKWLQNVNTTTTSLCNCEEIAKLEEQIHPVIPCLPARLDGHYLPHTDFLITTVAHSGRARITYL